MVTFAEPSRGQRHSNTRKDNSKAPGQQQEALSASQGTADTRLPLIHIYGGLPVLQFWLQPLGKRFQNRLRPRIQLPIFDPTARLYHTRGGNIVVVH